MARGFIESKEYVAEMMQFVVRHLVSLEVIDQADAGEVRAYLDECARHLAVEVRMRIAALETHREERGEVETLADWWQAFRQRWLPRWWLRRWPVKVSRVALETVHYRVCPHVRREPYQSHLHWLAVGEPEIRRRP